ncbi:MAG: cardiolipin synthase [Desulfosudaceae bacterium]
MDKLTPILTFLILFLEVLGILTALHAILFIRSVQGAIAWAVSLVTFPWLALPLYWIFGRDKFKGYRETLRTGNIQARHLNERTKKRLSRYTPPPDESDPLAAAFDQVFTHLADMDFTIANSVTLLVNGRETFETMFSRIESAKSFVLLEFFIIRNDNIGRRLRDLLIRKAGEQVKIYFLYDEIGSRHLDNEYLDPLTAAGVQVRPFFTTRGRRNRFQLNFRNHRKIVVIDGRIGFVGGHNIGDEYLGTTRKYGTWRDSHVMVEGPAVLGIQLTFNGDWFWATREKLEIEWNVHPSPSGNMAALPLATDPSHTMDTCQLFFLNAILAARHRLWIASPYFVPNDSIIEALQIAALKGVDVRILLPGRPDKKIVYLASFAFFRRLSLPNIKIYRYQPGFMHQKVMIIDDTMSVVGSANFDNRSFNLNFEMDMLIKDRDFSGRVEQMLRNDFKKSRRVEYPGKYKNNWLFQLAVRLCSLFSPIL